ncbi:MAG: hypothetical protein QI223_04885 [Candidatus Korarchaeota archaeon]|nr:hypothetical protein [Candidatus Korarchaeota archaeon]
MSPSPPILGRVRPEIPVALALTLIALAFFWPLIAPSGAVDPEDMTLVVPGGELAAGALENSSALAYDSLWVEVDPSAVALVRGAAARSLEMLARAGRAAEESGGTGLSSRVLAAVRAYRHAAVAADSSARAASILDAVRPGVWRAVGNLTSGDVQAALAEWSEVAADVRRAREMVREALLNLSSVDDSALLSPSHAEILNESRGRLEALARELDVILALFSLVESNPEAAQKALSAAAAARDGRLSPQEALEVLSSPGVARFVSGVSSLSPRDAGRFGGQVSQLRALIEALSRAAQGDQARGPCQGPGAGRGERPND